MKKIIAFAAAAVLTLSLASVSVFASDVVDMPFSTGGITNGVDKDGKTLDKVTVTDGRVVADYVNPGKAIYIELPDSGTVTFPATGGSISVSDLYDSDDFTFKLDRDQNGKYLDSVKFVSRNLNGTGRRNYIEVILKSSALVEDEKVTFDVFFKARRSEAGRWDSGDYVNTRFELWLDYDYETGDATVETGDGIVFKPISNETNTITWGGDYEVASLEFNASSDAKKFYTKLTTKINRNIYDEYGEPANADLFFRTFSGDSRIDSTSRATLTLYNPWSEDSGDYNNGYVDPRDCYIYSADGDGYLEDITHLFTYVDADETDAGIDGWRAKVHTLGSYIISDVDLDISGYVDDGPVPDPAPAPAPAPITPGTPIPSPPTGSHDFVAAASALLMLSCAAFAVSRKRK